VKIGRRTLRVFASGLGTGFVAGAFLVCAIVWQYGNVVGSRAANRAHPPATPPAIERFGGGIDDAGTPVVDGVPAPIGTAGEPSPVALPAPTPEPVVGAVPADELAARNLVVPVEGVNPNQLTRTFSDRRSGGRAHEAIDILAPMKTPVVAVEDGTIARLFLSKAGGITVYQFDPSERYCYYYAHLDHYAEGLREGQKVRRGQVLGYVGVSGNAPKQTPHLHFAIFRLTEAKHWWEGSPIDPYDILK
jgi:murein DD-endopeptidase MepM/ murein hydrolase activator NlpD